MDCPVDGTTLLMSERLGIEIDYCPQCRGVWLDRGELDKLLERNDDDVDRDGRDRDRDRYAAPPPAYPPQAGYPQPGYPPQGGHYGQKRKKHKGFLGEIFDFD